MTATTATTQPTTTITTTPATGRTVLGNQGAWSDEETERLKKMAEEHQAKATGEINWDAVIQEWGISQMRFTTLFCSFHFHCINWYWIGTKFLSRLLHLDSRRVQHVVSNAVKKMPQVMCLQLPSTSTAPNVMGMPSMSSPSHSGSMPASPVLQNIQWPSSAKSTAPIAAAPATQ